ncbi:MAG TPA: 2-succinyl-5-enolpyruvyl-6-hydroxy-3-cyclohexene-1-carboxylic-acid synthase [Marmoricola sp.]|nr:2-succinyl-5-enolpyruvyl-6-hydroxy-3-cyclohexene-1-carboxylic-acid synthase [Marmoricola sp.]
MTAPPANGSTALARTVVDELVRGGVRHVVLCPGSRSAALAFAVHAAATSGFLTLHTRIDERTAGFLALGLARTSRSPVAVVTTSGTAVANLHPAVLEADHAGVPLVVVTADRPAALRGTGANQTTDQVKVYGGAVRAFADVPPAAPGHREAEQLRGWRSLVARTLLTATGQGATARGPVHLNLQVEPPMTPDVEGGWSTPVDGRPDGAAWTVPAPAAPGLEESLDTAPRTVVVAGDDAGPPARVLAERHGWPLLAEPTSGSRTGANAIRCYRLLLGDPALADRVERVVVCGHPTLSRPVTQLLSRTDVEVVGLVPPGSPTGRWADPGHAVSRVVHAVALPDAVPAPDDWLREWLDRDAEVGRRLDELLAAEDGLTPQEVAGAVAAALPPGGLLFVGASNPVRDLDVMVPRYRVGDRRMVVGNRGLAGIDGTVSSAVGAALGRPRSTRALALLGDVTFLHDLTGLVLGPEEPRPPLTVVVVNDDGGSIFSLLEQGADDHEASFERLFATPHGVDLAALCAATGTPHRRVTDQDSLVAVLERAPNGIEVVEAVVRRDDRRALDAAMRALVT